MDNKELLENKPEVETVVEDTTTNVATKNNKLKKGLLATLIATVATAGLAILGVCIKNKVSSKKATKEAEAEETSEEVM